MAEYERLNALTTHQPQAGAKVSFLPGSLGLAIERFLESDEFKSRATSTQRYSRRLLDELRRRYGAGLLRDLSQKWVKIIRDQMREAFSPSTADVAVSLLAAAWRYADDHLNLDLVPDPTVGVRRLHKISREHEPWPPELIVRFLASVPPNLQLALKLLLYTGQRRADVVSMTWSQFDGEVIEVRQQKTDELLVIPCHAVLRQVLAATPREHECILVKYRGEGTLYARRALDGLPAGVGSA
jgi:integrase